MIVKPASLGATVTVVVATLFYLHRMVDGWGYSVTLNLTFSAIAGSVVGLAVYVAARGGKRH